MTSDSYVINLDPEFTPYDFLYVIEFETMDFYGGEPNIKVLSNTDNYSCLDTNESVIITQRYNSPKDLIMIILANDALRRMGFTDIHLILPYFPAARQDRVCNEGEPLTSKVFADMINNCKFTTVEIFCPHSEVIVALLDSVQVRSEIPYVVKAVNDYTSENPVKEMNIVCPDAGAGKRVEKVVKALKPMFADIKFNLIRCEKIRDVSTGKLEAFFVMDDDLGGHPSMIVDDINCMGGTFIGLGKELRERNCGDLMLFTAHSDCVDGVQNVVAHFDKVYTTNSKKNWDKFKYTFDDRLVCFKY